MKTIIFAVLALTATGCASPKYFGSGKYVEADYSNPTHSDDKFNEFDSKSIIQAALKDFEKCSDKAHVLMLARLDNQTSESIDTVQLQRELVDTLTTTGYSVIDKTGRPDLHEEYLYSKAGYVDPTKAPRIGKQEGVNFILRAALVSKVQTDGDTKTIRYRLSIQSVDTESALVKCNGIAEIKKHFERTRVGL
jgi:hypothetical protein